MPHYKYKCYYRCVSCHYDWEMFCLNNPRLKNECRFCGIPISAYEVKVSCPSELNLLN